MARVGGLLTVNLPGLPADTSGMGELLMWFVAVNVGILWCLWTLAREAKRHAAWHIAARRERRRADAAEQPAADFRVVALPVLPGQLDSTERGLRRVG